MAITTFNDEHISPIPPARIFKASIMDSHNLTPKLMPQAIKSIEIIQGNGGAGSIKHINFAEGDALIDGLKKISYTVKFEPTVEGGSISKVTSKYYTKGEFKLNEEGIKVGKERILAMYKAIETYLLQNPGAYA